MGAEVDSQVAAPAETGTPNWHRAKIAHKRVRMEGWRQRRLGSEPKTHLRKHKNVLTRTGLLMEGLGSIMCRPRYAGAVNWNGSRSLSGILLNWNGCGAGRC